MKRAGSKSGVTKKYLSIFWVTAVVVGVLALFVLSTRSPSSQKLNGCFGGLLSQYPLHCEFLEDAHNNDQISIEAIYQIGDALFLFLNQPGGFSETEAESLRILARTKIAKFDAWGDCRTEHGYDFDERGCALGVLEIPGHWEDRLLPQMAQYEDLVLKIGGVVSLGLQPAAASYVKRWPVTAGGQGGQSNSGISTRSSNQQFDVSDINLGNVPPVDCDILQGNEIRRSCLWWERHPEFDIAGVFDGNYPKTYVLIKATTNQQTKAATTKASLIAKYDHLDQSNLVVTAIDHNFSDLWKWMALLNKFAYSSANSVGIDYAFITVNQTPPSSDTIIPASGPGLAPDDAPNSLRTTIAIGTYDLSGTVAALPQLLPALGIPVSAVGIVHRFSFEGGLVGEPAIESVDSE